MKLNIKAPLLKAASKFGRYMMLASYIVSGAAIVGSGIVYVDKARCEATAGAMRIEKSWGPLQGCIVQWGGHLMPLSQISLRGDVSPPPTTRKR
jgi:hypothetical protein